MKDKEQKIRQMAASGKYYLKDIAEIIKVKPNCLAYFCRKNAIKSTRKKGAHNIVHANIREKVMTYYMIHDVSQTMKKFNLTKSNFKSLMTCGYRIESLKHLRKDTRTKEPFNLKTILSIIKFSGLIKREDIAIKLKRGKKCYSIKEYFANRGAGETRYLNGISKKWADLILGDNDLVCVKTNAGPKGFESVIISWVDAYEFVKMKRSIKPEIKACLRAMAKFQKFIYQTKDISKINKIIRGSVNG